jgi:hypothetical protein
MSAISLRQRLVIVRLRVLGAERGDDLAQELGERGPLIGTVLPTNLGHGLWKIFQLGGNPTRCNLGLGLWRSPGVAFYQSYPYG